MESNTTKSTRSSKKASTVAAAAEISPKPVSAAEKVLSSFVGRQSEYQEFLKTTRLAGLNLRVIKDILHFFPAGHEAIAKKVARGLEVNALVKTLSYEADEIDKDLRAFASAVIESWSKDNGKVNSLRMVPSEDKMDASVLVTVKDAFSIEKKMLLALKNKIGAEKYAVLFKEEESLILKGGEYRALVVAFLRKTFGEDAIEKIFDRKIDTSVRPEGYTALLESSDLDEETKKLIQNVVMRAEPTVKYPK